MNRRQYDRPDHLKFGYDHMVEMAQIRAELAAQGVTGTKLHFAAISQYEKRHTNDPTYAERCAVRRNAGPIPVAGSLVEALRLIRDGHNDPRALAREVLALYEQ